VPPALEAALGHLASRRPEHAFDVRWFDTVESTMNVAAMAAAEGEQAGFVAIADRQTAGRGRRGREWSSPSGAGLYFSYLARPTRYVELVTLAAGVAVLGGIAASTGLIAHLKWPNDVLVGSRKLAGLLAEGAHLATPEASVVIGIGINLQPAAHPPDVDGRATNLQAVLGRDVSRFDVFAAVLEQLADTLAALEAGRAGDILRRWRDASPLAAGTRVEWTKDGVDVDGVTAGIDESGALLVETASGLERVIAGELRWQLPDS
jgi:BirA family biotin operon repressor/biotin-[acetyl-CoA-carboxylase] ligase